MTGLLAADRMIRHQGCDLVAVVAGDAVSSLDTDDFLKRADAGCVLEMQIYKIYLSLHYHYLSPSMCAVVKTLRTLCQVQVWLLLRCDYAAWHKHISPSVIPSGYDRVAQWHIENGHFTREQLAMAAVLMSRQVRHAKTPPGCRFGRIHAGFYQPFVSPPA